MKVFVTGATGYVGSAICEALRAAGHQVSGLVRGAEKAQALESRGVIAHVGSLEDTAGLANAVKACDAVIHTAQGYGADAGAIARSAVAAMLDALAGSKRPFIYTSGVWVHGDTDGRMVGEAAMLNPPVFVAGRPEVEDLVLQAADRGVAAMVLRPGMVFGRKGGALGGFFQDAREHGAVRIIGNGENHWSNVHADDLADLYVRAVAEPHAGELFIACGGMPQLVGKIAEAVAAKCGIAGKVEKVPLDQARQTLGLMADCLAMDLKAGSTKAARFFGWRVHHPSIFEEIGSGSYLS